MGNQPSGNKEKGPFDVRASWKSEEKLSNKERRERYACGSKFIEPGAIQTWDKKVDEVLNTSPTKRREEARCAEKLRRKLSKWSLKLQNFEQQFEDLKKQVESTSNSNQETKAENAPENDETKKSKDEKRGSSELKTEEKELIKKRMKIKDLKLKIRDTESQLKMIEDNKPKESYKHNDAINKKIALIRSDITRLELDAIVNAANKSLLGGGGIDGAIHRAAGPTLYKECTTLNGGVTGETKITRGYNLPAKYVLHTIGPIGEHEPELIQCYNGCLDFIGSQQHHKIKTIAFCGISTGVYGYPLYPASHVALNTIRKWMENEENLKKVDLIVICTYLEIELECYEKLMPLYFPPTGKTSDDVVKDYQDVFDAYIPANDTTLDQEIEEEKQKKKQKGSFLFGKPKDKPATDNNNTSNTPAPAPTSQQAITNELQQDDAVER